MYWLGIHTCLQTCKEEEESDDHQSQKAGYLGEWRRVVWLGKSHWGDQVVALVPFLKLSGGN